jgi:hypothetical protein
MRSISSYNLGGTAEISFVPEWMKEILFLYGVRQLANDACGTSSTTPNIIKEAHMKMKTSFSFKGVSCLLPCILPAVNIESKMSKV